MYLVNLAITDTCSAGISAAKEQRRCCEARSRPDGARSRQGRTGYASRSSETGAVKRKFVNEGFNGRSIDREGRFLCGLGPLLTS